MTERALILCKGPQLGSDDFPVKQQKPEVAVINDEMINLRISEVAMIRRALQNSQYNQSAAADQLGITRDALIRKMKKYDIAVCKNEE